MNSPKSKKTTPVFQKKTSPFIFLGPVLIFFALLFYILSEKNTTNFLFGLFGDGFLFIKTFLMFNKKKIVISDKKIYIYIRGKKFITWTFLDDFYIVNYRTNLMGKLFNYGTLIIINKDKKMYEYYYLEDVTVVYQKIIENYEKLMKKLDPTFNVSYKDKIEPDNIDKIE